jgi:hypothetical protein
VGELQQLGQLVVRRFQDLEDRRLVEASSGGQHLLDDL